MDRTAAKVNRIAQGPNRPGHRFRGFRTGCSRGGPVLLLSALILGLSPSVAQQATEYEIKAAWLLNFAKFTEWPKEAMPLPGQPMVIAICGKDPFGPVLDRLLRDKTVLGHSVTLRRGETMEELAGSHVVFLGGLPERDTIAFLEALEHRPVLTIGESESFNDRGGHIQFVLRKNRVRFTVNLGSIRGSGLKISPKLLNLAVPSSAPRTHL